MFDYSKDFLDLIKDTNKARELIEGSHVKDVDFDGWEKGRSFIVQAINKNGSILDIGCANGFFLRCFQEWCQFKLEPYGIDNDEFLIDGAKKSFPQQKDHFITLPLQAIESLADFGLPSTFDFVFWNVWDNRVFKTEEDLELIRKALSAVALGGRLILSFYDKERKTIDSKIERLKESGFSLSEKIYNNSGTEVASWIDKV